MKNVLVVEDDVILADDLKFFVENAGHSCTKVNRADDVLALIDKIEQFDVVVLDIMMMRGNLEKRNNYETGETLYSMIKEKCKNMHFFVLSAKDSKNMQIDFESEKNTVFLNKPIDEGGVKDLIAFIGDA